MRAFKRIAIYLFLVFMATLIFYGGAGVNLVSYCCSHCQQEGIEALLHDHCGRNQRYASHGHTHFCKHCCMANHTDMSKRTCGIERVHFNWIVDDDLYVSTPDPICQQLYATLISALDAPLHFQTVYAWQEVFLSWLVSPPRIYLSKLSTLLI